MSTSNKAPDAPSSDGEREALPPLTDAMFHAVRGLEFATTDSQGYEGVPFCLTDDDIERIWDAINTALRIQRAAFSSDRETHSIAPTGEQIERHKLQAKDCPPDSEVILVSSLKRLQTMHISSRDLARQFSKRAAAPADEPQNISEPADFSDREMAPEAKAKDSVNQTGAQVQQPEAADVGWCLTDKHIEAGFHSFEWSSVPHPFRGSVGFERGARWATERFANPLREALQEAADRIEGIKGGSVSDTIALMRAALASSAHIAQRSE